MLYLWCNIRKERSSAQTYRRKACTCYTVGGMPLAFTQEDFLVFLSFILKLNTGQINSACHRLNCFLF